MKHLERKLKQAAAPVGGHQPGFNGVRSTHANIFHIRRFMDTRYCRVEALAELGDEDQQIDYLIMAALTAEKNV